MNNDEYNNEYIIRLMKFKLNNININNWIKQLNISKQ